MKCFAVKFSELAGRINPTARWDVPFLRLIAALNGRAVLDGDFVSYLLALLSNRDDIARARLREIVEESTSEKDAVNRFCTYARLGPPPETRERAVVNRPEKPFLTPAQQERLVKLLRHAAAFRVDDLARTEQRARINKKKLAKKFHLCPKKLPQRKCSASSSARTAAPAESTPTTPS